MEEGVGSLMGKIRKNLFVCVGRKCKRRDSMSCCPSPEEFIPDDCGYAIFHSLETDRMEIAQRGRQTGKTTTLVRAAEKLAAAGCDVYYLTRTHEMGRLVRQRHHLSSRIPILSFMQVREGWHYDRPAGYVVADELSPSELKEVEDRLPMGTLVAAYWT